MKNSLIKKTFLVLLLIFTIIGMVACNTPTPSSQDTDKEQDIEESVEQIDITVSAAISLTDAMEEIKEIYEGQNKNINIIYNFGASGALMQQIEEGAPVDIFLSAAQKQMNQLEEKDLILKDSRKDFVANDLVLIVNKNHQDIIKSIDDLTSLKNEKIAIGEPESVPAGKYTVESLQSLGLYDDLLENVVFTKNVRQVITYVDSENTIAGFCYGSDAIAAKDSVVVQVVEDNSHEPIVYPAAIVKDTTNIEASKDFLSFILSSEAKDIFEKYGFSKI